MHIDRSAGPSPDREQAVTSSSSSSPVENRAPRVLVADDDDTTRMVLAESLRADGYEVLEAANGRELFWAIETSTHDHALDLVVADIRMPAYSGLEVAEAWAEIGLPRTILMTAYPDDCVRSRVEGLGMRLIDKPCDVQELLRLVRELVGSPHGRRDPDSHPGEGGSRVG